MVATASRKNGVTSSRRRRAPAEVHTLAIDVGGTGLKASVLDGRGRLTVERVRVETPVGAPPEVYVETLARLVEPLPGYQRISVGFPGVVRGGVVRTAPNLKHKAWSGFDLASALTARLGRPTRVANDADVQGLAVISGVGMEMVITLGTGFGTAIFLDGRLGPHLELAHHPFRKGQTYDQQLGEPARKQVGNKKWNKRVAQALEELQRLTHFDTLYIGGGNAKKLGFKLPDNVKVVSNEAGIAGGVHLWRD
ncbi:MAG: ROK family protein [Myxococcota bacterium]